MEKKRNLGFWFLLVYLVGFLSGKIGWVVVGFVHDSFAKGSFNKVIHEVEKSIKK